MPASGTCSSCLRSLPDGARFCPNCGHEVVTAATEERRVVTVLFADIVGYSSLSEHLDPERLKRLIDAAFQRLIVDIESFGGTIDKVLGDAILALFGAPIAHEDDADRAIRAALQLHETLDQFVHAQIGIDGPLHLRVGVNTGEVVVGTVAGTAEYTAMGDVVNVAARLQAMAPPGAVYIGDSTAELAPDEIQRMFVDDIDVIGRERSERVWRVTGLERRVPSIGVRTDVPFVGRINQRELLSSVMTMVANGRSAVVAVTGEAGSGKTRLVSEMLETFPSRSRRRVRRDLCALWREQRVGADRDRTVPTDEPRPGGADRGAPGDESSEGDRVLPLRRRRPGARPVRRDGAAPDGAPVDVRLDGPVAGPRDAVLGGRRGASPPLAARPDRRVARRHAVGRQARASISSVASPVRWSTVPCS